MNTYDFDVIVIGGGINGLAAAAYLGKAGLSVAVFEARSECGAHCNTENLTHSDFLHNLHATWLITALSPAMEDLELEKFGLELVGTDYAYGKTFLDGKCALLGTFPQDTFRNWEKLSPKDADFFLRASELLLENFQEILEMVHDFLFTPPKYSKIEKQVRFFDKIVRKLGIGVPPEEIVLMNGFQALDIFFESEHIKTLILSLSWIGAMPPIYRKIGSVGCLSQALMTGPIFPVHQAKGGSHALTHSLIRCAKHHGVKIFSNCPVSEIIMKDGQAVGVKLLSSAVFPSAEFYAKKIISNLTLTETFRLIKEQDIDPEIRAKARFFCYDEQVIFGVHYMLSQPPIWSSCEFDEGIQRCFMGYLGGDSVKEMKEFAVELISGVIPQNLMANWFVPTLADPSQAPEGYHTAFLWLDVPPIPIRFGEEKLEYNFSMWDKVKWKLAEKLTDLFERYAPGFKKNVIDMFPYSPLDVWRNNKSAIKGNWCGGSVIPEQFFALRPLAGITKYGASRTFIENLYLSNSIHPYGATWLASGYISACEVIEDMGLEKPNWWKAKACEWYIKNISKIPRNLGVPAKFKKQT
jgi:phytoene dehydrogenase-like protein